MKHPKKIEDYNWITDKMFHQKLNDIVKYYLGIKKEVDILNMLSQISPSSYEELSEFFNNQVLQELQEERPPMTAQEFFDGNLEGCPICHDHLAQLEAMEIEKEENIVSITYTCPECSEEFVFKMECKPIKIEY